MLNYLFEGSRVLVADFSKPYLSFKRKHQRKIVTPLVNGRLINAEQYKQEKSFKKSIYECTKNKNIAFKQAEM
jgi:hypothetical protein